MIGRIGVNSGSGPLVSVHIISYNQQDLIAETLDSVLAQSFDDYEIIVSDDASTDRTPDIIADYARRHPRIRPLLHRNNAGITSNSNRGLRACRGKYIAFLGGDDLFCPDKLASQLRWFEEREDRVLCGHQVEVFYDDHSQRPHRFQRILRSGHGAAKLIRYGSFAACSVMVRSDRLPAHGFEESLPTVSDYMLWVETLAQGGEYGYIPGVHARYRRHSHNISRNAGKMTADAIGAFDLIKQRYPQYGKSCDQAYGRFVHYPRAVEMLEKGDRHGARRELHQALRIDPSFVQAWLTLARTYGR